MAYSRILLSIIAICFITNCSWQLHSVKVTSPEIKEIIFESNNLNDQLVQAIHNRFHIHGIKLIPLNVSNQNIPSLNILTSDISQETESIFQNNYIIRCKIILTLRANIVIPGENTYPIDIKIHRFFFSNLERILARDNEKNIVISEMYDVASGMLFSKFVNNKSIY